jgi:uncharacterized iron-regulated protein
MNGFKSAVYGSIVLLFSGGIIIGGISSCNSTSSRHGDSGMRLTDHPLVDKIWDVAQQKYVDKDRFLQALQDNDYLLLGETHDNAVHHEYQAWAIEQLHKQGKSLSVAFEMINQSQYGELENQTFNNADAVFDVLDWENTGWPERKLYAPVFSATIKAGYDIYPANIDRKRLSEIIMQGEDLVPEEIKDSLNKTSLTPEAEEQLRKDIADSHCNMLPEQMVPAMVLGQRVRDAVMAKSLIANRASDGIVFIGGSGHTQKQGVPIFIEAKEPGAKVVSVAWMEVDERFKSPQDYSDYWGRGELPFDYVWFTPRLDRPDPCEELKKHHKFKAQAASETGE